MCRVMRNVITSLDRATVAVIDVNWCPAVVSIRQQVSPILSLDVISSLIDQ